MTVQAVEQVERRFQQLKQELSDLQWDDPEYLMEKSEQLKTSDLALSLRILQRVRNLLPDDHELRDKVKSLNDKLRGSDPESMRSSSSENAPVVALVESSVSVQQSTAAKEEKPEELQNGFNFIQYLRRPFVAFVLLPFLLFAFYQCVWASIRYESQSQLIVQQPNGLSTLDPSVALLAGFSGTATSSDTELVKAYIHSNDLLAHLQQSLDFASHFKNDDYDFFSRLSSDASSEEQLEYYLNRIGVEINANSSVITVKTQGFNADFAQRLNQVIVERAEWYINKIGNDLAKAQLNFIKQEHDLVREKLDLAKANLLEFQRSYNLLDPEAEGIAFQQITYGLESQIAAKKAELNMLQRSMSDSAPLVVQAKQELLSLEAQLVDERSRLTQVIVNVDENASQQNIGVNEVLAKYSELKVDLEFALQAYSASQVSIEKSRIEAYRQLKYLVVVEAPTLPEDAAYPRILYNLSLFFVLAVMLFGIGKIISATVKELK